MSERNHSDQISVTSSQNESNQNITYRQNAALKEKQARVLRAFCNALIGELNDEELEILLNTKSSMARKAPEIVRKFGKFDLSKQEDIIDRIVDRLAKSAPPHKLQQIGSVLNRLSSRSIINSQIIGINKPFHELTQKQREAAFIKWSTSQTASVRKIYRSFSMLICATFWLNPYGFNTVIGYPGPDPNGSRFSSQDLRDYDFLKVEDSEFKEFDAVIVGSGAGGSVAAARLSKMGYKVLVIEKGHHYNRGEITTEQEDGYDKLYELAGGMLSEDSSVYILAGSNFGGGTTVGWSASMEPQYFVREEWARKFGLPYFMEDEYGDTMKSINAILGANTNNITHNASNQALIDGCKKLGLHHDTVPQNAASKPHQCGWCSFGCKNGEKQSATKTWLNEAKGNGAKFLQDCYVENVLIDKDGKRKRAIGVEAIIDGKKRIKVYADRVIVASGAIHTPTLLLRSGLRNRNIGRNLHLHPTAAVYGVFPDKDIKTYSGTIMSAISNADENVDGENYGTKIVVGSHHPGFMFTNFPWKSALQHKQLMLEYNHIVPLMVITRDREGGRIFIDGDGKPRLEYKLSNHDAKSMVSGMLTAIKILIAAGASKVGTCQAGVEEFIVESGVNTFNDPRFSQFLDKVKRVGVPANQACIGSTHQMSSCRMGDDPTKSAVNPVGETWEVENLHVADSSLFPTATGVPPMMAAMNISYYISRCIVGNRGYIRKKRESTLLGSKEPSHETRTVDLDTNTPASTTKKDKRISIKRLSLNLSLKSFSNN